MNYLCSVSAVREPAPHRIPTPGLLRTSPTLTGPDGEGEEPVSTGLAFSQPSHRAFSAALDRKPNPSTGTDIRNAALHILPLLRRHETVFLPPFQWCLH